MFSFCPSSTVTKKIYISNDPAFSGVSDEAKSEYLSTSDSDVLGDLTEACTFSIKALSPKEREDAEIRAGAYQRSELGRLLFSQQPDDSETKARWHHNLDVDERTALAEYHQYLQDCYIEMIRVSLVSIQNHGEEYTENLVDQLNLIKPESARVSVISELIVHIQRLSLLGDRPKSV
jgi:hypothetical protein